MRRGLLFSFLVALVLVSLSFVVADNSEHGVVAVSAGIVEPTLSVEISPGEVFLGDLTKGYESDAVNLTALNTGDIDVRITPVIDSTADDLFNYLEFATGTCSSYSNISKWQSSIIDAPDIFGGIGEEYDFCMHLDLKDYEEEIPQGKLISTEVVFWVTAA